MTPLYRQLLGKKGEEYAADYLQNHGYHIIERNFKINPGELDIIAVIDDILVFVEVKTRVGREFGLPEESVTPKKLREIIKTSQYYAIIRKGLPIRHRIDVIGIEYTHSGEVVYFNHIQNASS